MEWGSQRAGNALVLKGESGSPRGGRPARVVGAAGRLSSAPVEAAERRQVMASAVELAELVDWRAGLFTSRGEFAARQYGAAGLVRGCGLMRAAFACHEAGQDEAVGILTRAIMESWISGAFILFGGAESLARMEAEHQRNQRNLIASNRINASDLVAQQKAEIEEAAKTYGFRLGEDGEPRFDSLTVRVMAEDLGSLIEAATGERSNIVLLYDLLYRSYSTFDTHGLEPLGRQLDLDDLSLTTMRRPTPWIEPHGSIGVACLLLAMLAKWVFDAYRIGTSEVERIFETVGPIMERAGLTAVALAPQQVIDALPPDFPRPADAAE